MLVLSRHETDSIHFPDLDITIEVLRIKGRSVRIGIEAPIEIKVLRGELNKPSEQQVTKKVVIDDEDSHEVRNKLHSLSMAVGLAEQLIESGTPAIAAKVLDEALTRLANSEEASAPPTIVAGFDDDVARARALLVEDVANERMMLAGFLRLHGFSVDSVSDGLQALDYLESHQKPDFILMDMGMPNMDGPAAIRSIRSNPAFDNVMIYAVSGQTPQGVGIDISKNRIAHWFQKPLEPSTLVSMICQATDSIAVG